MMRSSPQQLACCGTAGEDVHVDQLIAYGLNLAEQFHSLNETSTASIVRENTVCATPMTRLTCETKSFANVLLKSTFAVNNDAEPAS